MKPFPLNALALAPFALALVFLPACNSTDADAQYLHQAWATLSGAAQADSVPHQPVHMDSGEMTVQQLRQLSYLAPGQSPQAMQTWANGRYPAYIQGNSELWRLQDQPGTCVRLTYSAAGYDGNYTFQPCP